MTDEPDWYRRLGSAPFPEGSEWLQRPDRVWALCSPPDVAGKRCQLAWMTQQAYEAMLKTAEQMRNDEK